MSIVQVETRPVELPYTKPLVTATNNFTVARDLLVKVEPDDGTRAVGA